MAAALLLPAQTATRPAGSALPGTSEGGWREFRGDPRNTGVCHGPAPAFSKVRWRFIAESELLNAPAVDAGALYFASRGGRIYAVKASDGSKIWERSHAAPADEKAEYFGFKFGNVLLHEGRLYVGSEDGHLYCVSQKNGDLLWRRHLGGSADLARVWASPKTDGRLVFIGSSSGFFWALDAVTGAEKWKAWIGDQIAGSAAIIGGDVLVTARDKRLHVLDAATGAERWRAELGGTSMSTPALELGCAFMRASGGKVVCVDLVNRSVRWTAELGATSYAQTCVAHDGERAYVTNAGTLAALGDDGAPLWQFKTNAVFDSSPILVGGWVVITGNDRMLRALDRKTGAVVREMDLGDKIVAAPTIVDGIAYVAGSSGTLFAIE